MPKFTVTATTREQVEKALVAVLKEVESCSQYGVDSSDKRAALYQLNETLRAVQTFLEGISDA